MHIPARYCTGYLGDIGVPRDPAPMDFSAWFEAFLGDRGTVLTRATINLVAAAFSSRTVAMQQTSPFRPRSGARSSYGFQSSPKRRISPRAVAHQDQPAVRRVLPLSLTFDHRIVTGGEAARFLVALKSDLELMS
jgi:hypothetical protein